MTRQNIHFRLSGLTTQDTRGGREGRGVRCPIRLEPAAVGWWGVLSGKSIFLVNLHIFGHFHRKIETQKYNCSGTQGAKCHLKEAGEGCSNQISDISKFPFVTIITITITIAKSSDFDHHPFVITQS